MRGRESGKSAIPAVKSRKIKKPPRSGFFLTAVVLFLITSV